MSIGKRLREYLSERRLTQEEFSALCQVSKQTINNIVQDKTAPSGDVLVKIAKEYYDLNLNWLITGKGDMFNLLEELDEVKSHQYNVANQSNYQVLINEKDKIITSQQETIEALKETISTQKQLLDYKK